MMSAHGQPLEAASILILEDEYYLAMDLQDALEAAGATIIGPFADEAEATRELTNATPSCAFVDVNLGSGPCFSMPRALAQAGVPFVFVTGYDAETIPDDLAAVPRLAKPIDAARTVEAALRLLKAR